MSNYSFKGNHTWKTENKPTWRRSMKISLAYIWIHHKSGLWLHHEASAVCKTKVYTCQVPHKHRLIYLEQSCHMGIHMRPICIWYHFMSQICETLKMCQKKIQTKIQWMMDASLNILNTEFLGSYFHGSTIAWYFHDLEIRFVPLCSISVPSTERMVVGGEAQTGGRLIQVRQSKVSCQWMGLRVD